MLVDSVWLSTHLASSGHEQHLSLGSLCDLPGCFEYSHVQSFSWSACPALRGCRGLHLTSCYCSLLALPSTGHEVQAGEALGSGLYCVLLHYVQAISDANFSQGFNRIYDKSLVSPCLMQNQHTSS